MPDYFGTYQNVNCAEYLDFFAAAYGLTPRQRNRVIDDLPGRRRSSQHLQMLYRDRSLRQGRLLQRHTQDLLRQRSVSRIRLP